MGTEALYTSRKSLYKENKRFKSIKAAIWIYFFLLIFEGALRKWVLPSLATPLLLIRDPIAIWTIYKAYNLRILPDNNYIKTFLAVGLISIVTAVLLGHGNFIVALYGARPFLFFVPFMFIIGKVFTQHDVIRLGKACLWLSIMMTVLIAIQFYSPQSAWVNRGIGGDEGGAGFSGALGYMRPPGTFSFTNGVGLFYDFLSSFICYFWLNPKRVNRWLLIASSCALIAAIPLSISRGLMFSVLVTVALIAFAIARKPKYISKFIIGGVALAFVLFILSQTKLFSTASDVLSKRIETANEQSQGGDIQSSIVERYLDLFFKPFSQIFDMPFWGYGSGKFTSVGSKLLSGEVVSGISEGEIGRLIGELGLIMGLTIVIARLSLIISIFTRSYKKLKESDLLPWSLLGFVILQGPQANWAQPTSLGFGIFGTGLILAALKHKRINKPGLKNRL